MGAAHQLNDNKLFLKDLLSHPELLKVIADKLKETISGYTHSEVSGGKPALLNGTDKSNLAVAGLIRFEGKDFSIELFLGFSRELFSFLYENMFQMPVDEINSENHDLAGEILNIAFGAMDPEFKKLGYTMKASFPKVYSGKDLETMMESISSKAISIPYQCEGKTFTVNIYAADSLKEHWNFS